MPAEIAAASSPPVQTCCPFLPITIAVPVSWHIGRTLPAAILAFFKRSKATNLSFDEASGSSSIARSCARWPGRSRCWQSTKASRASRVRAAGSILTMRSALEGPGRDVVAGELAVWRVVRPEREKFVIGGLAHASLRGAICAKSPFPCPRQASCADASACGTCRGSRFLPRAAPARPLRRRLGAGSAAASAGFASGASNCSPKLTDGSAKVVTAAKGMVSRSERL